MRTLSASCFLIAFLLLSLPAASESARARPAAASEESAVEPPPPRETQEEDKDLNLLTLLWRGGWVMIPIGLASILALTIAVERCISLRRKRVIPPGYLERLEARLGQSAARSGDHQAFFRENPCVLGSLIQGAFSQRERGEAVLKEALEDSGARQVDRLKRSIKPLSMIASIAPLLGLLGTVYGMIGAFQAASAAGVGKSDVLAEGIYEALVTTAAGLTLAIPVLIVYLVLNNKIDALTDDLDDAGEAFLRVVSAPAAQGSNTDGEGAKP